MGEDDVTKEEHASSDLADLEARRPPRLGCTRGPPLPAKRIWERIGHAEKILECSLRHATHLFGPGHEPHIFEPILLLSRLTSFMLTSPRAPCVPFLFTVEASLAGQ